MRRFLLLILCLLFVGVAALWAFDRFFPEQAVQVMRELERNRGGLTAGRVTVGEVEIAYLEGGEGEPLMLIHGFGADKDSYARLAGALTPHYRVLIPDVPGFGDSTRSKALDHSIVAQVERLRAFAREMDAAELHLGGISMGGWLATEWALQHEDEVRSLWLQAPAGTTAALDSELGRIMAADEANPLLVERVEDYPQLLEFVMSKPPRFVPSSVITVMGRQAVTDFALRQHIVEQLGTPDHDARIEGLATPALIVWGDEDRLLSVDAAERYAQAMPNASVVVIPGIGHVPKMEAPDTVIQTYRAFREQLAAESH